MLASKAIIFLKHSRDLLIYQTDMKIANVNLAITWTLLVTYFT